ncbi:hypothetical protein PHLGIDRAFT_19101 [Phlebiopsis gigantea 11061_1 CR5-6]|uniref:Uncharacterized protein n=1 Tax=Phlebiopsis gigantea (strain 11061_1 CR5-6) TaxID=745531 RepID=A0A0C3S8W2_PHLG1|nr:hypothetical protein PHLGIDRAFT_19101 [Phlebiopsis gigantea 11061_1 CR5-6]
MADAAAAHEEQVAALEADLTSTRDQHENAQLSIAEYSEKEVAWTEREGALISDAEERDARIKALEDDVAALREEQEQDRQRRLAEDNERTERDLVATAASLERERALAESHDARIKELTEELAALRAEREVDKQQRETEDAERREADKAEAKQVAEAHTTQLTGIEEQLAKIVEHSDEQFVQYEARVQEVVVRLDKIEDGAVKDRELHEAEMAEAAAKPTMESILDANKTDLQATILAQLESIESNLRTDGDEKHEDILAKLKTMVEEQASMAITGCIADFSAMLESLGTTQQAEILSALRIAIQEQVTLNISFYIEELSKTWDAHGARLLAEVLDTVRATARDVVEYNTENHLTDFCKNLAPEMLQLFHEIREKEEEKQKLDRQIDVLRRHKRDYESGDLHEQEDVPEEVPMKGAWRGRSEGRHRDHEPVSVPLPPQPEPLYAQVPPPPLSRRAPSFQEPDAGRPMSTWSSWHHGTMSHSSTDPSVQLALIAPPAEGGEYGGQSPYYRE